MACKEKLREWLWFAWRREVQGRVGMPSGSFLLPGGKFTHKIESALLRYAQQKDKSQLSQVAVGEIPTEQ